MSQDPQQPRFLTQLVAEQVGERDWRLRADLVYWSAVLGRAVTVPSGFVTDFASVPRAPVVYLLAGGTSVKPATVHDWLYRTVPHPSTREQADAVLREACFATGEPAWRAWSMWAAVRLFGGPSWRSSPNPSSSGEGNLRALGLSHRPPPPRQRAARVPPGPRIVKELL